jgi:uncharacterized protein (TIGR03083 family)
MEAPEDRALLVPLEAERLAQYVRALSPAVWMQPSRCEGWEVRDVVAHLIGVAELYVDTISRGLQGDAAPPPERQSTGLVSAEWVAQRAIANRERLGNNILPTFRARYDRLSHLFAGLERHDWEKLCYYPTIPSPIPVKYFIGLIIAELAIHGWDIRFQREPTAHLSVESVAVIVQWLPHRLRLVPLLRAFLLDAGWPTPVRYRWKMTDGNSETHDIVVEHDQCAMEPGGAAAANVTFRSDAETFVLLMYRRLPLETATATGHLIVEGDQELTAAFDRWLKGV